MHSRRDFLVASAGALSVMALRPEMSLASLAGAAKVRVGLVGCGRQGRNLIAELQKIENLDLAAVCDTDPNRLSAAQRRASGARAFADHRSMLNEAGDLAAVIIATPTHLHTQVALDAIAAGKHVYCEAPLAHTEDDCRAIARAAASAKTLFGVALEGRSNPVYNLARSFYRSDAVREAIAIQTQSFQKTSWRFPASDRSREQAVNWRLDPAVSLGLAGEMGIQQFDTAFWYTEQYPVSVRGHGSVRFHQDGRTVADTAGVEMTFANKLRLTSLFSLANSFESRQEIFRGSNATIKLAWSHGWMFKEADAPTQGWEVYANRQKFHNDEGITLIADATKLAEQGKLQEGVGLPYPSLYYPLWNFANALATGGRPNADASAGARATIVSILAARAVATESEIAIDPALLSI